MADAGESFHLRVSPWQLLARYALPVLGAGAAPLIVDVLRYGHVSISSLVLAGVILPVGLGAATVLCRPRVLKADDHGILWRCNGKSTVVRWDEITDIGVARNVVYQNRTMTSLIYGNRLASAMRRPMIGLAVKPDHFPPGGEGTRAYLRGFTGYDVNIPNDFEMATVTLVERLRTLWAARTASPSPS